MERVEMSGQPSVVLPWRTRISLAFLSAVTDSTRRSNGTINRRLANLLDAKAPPNNNPSSSTGVETSDVTVDPSRNLWFRLFVPTDVNASAGGGGEDEDELQLLPVILFFHGGGFIFLGANSRAYDAVCRRFARTFPAVVVSVNYRLAPEHRYPSQYDDGYDVLKFLEDSGGSILPEKADLGRCFLAGDSAGANLCHHVALRSASDNSDNKKKVRLVGLVAIQPFFGGEERTESEMRLIKSPLVSLERTDWIWKAFLPAGSDRDHPAVNVCGPNTPDTSNATAGYPATLVVVGGLDPLQDWQRRYYEWLKRSGNEADLVYYPNAIHAFYVFPELPEASLLLTKLQNFIRDHT